MKKITLLFMLLLGAAAVHAQMNHAAVSYIHSSDFDQVRAGTAVAAGTLFHLGAQAHYTKDRLSVEKGGYKDPVFSVYLPMKLELEMIDISFSPFYYFKTKSPLAESDDPYAFGATAQLAMTLREDDIEDLYTQAYLQAGFARQKGILEKNNAAHDANYSEMAYTLGLRQNFYGAFVFQTNATAYQYPNGISNVQGFRGIFDQNDLAFAQSYDVNRQLGKYVLSARFSRIWQEERSSLYVGYHYAEFYTADPQHSLLIGNSFYIGNAVHADIAYNHLQTTNNKNKRDIFFINLNFIF